MAVADDFSARDHGATDASDVLEARPRVCPLCGADEPRPVGIARGPWTVARCGACGFGYLTAAPPLESLSNEYAWEKAAAAEATRRRRARPIVQWLDERTRWRLHIFPRPETRRFIERLAEPGPVLDLGCGDGRQALKLPERYVPYGVEISADLAARADMAFRARAGACVHAPAQAGVAQFPENQFTGAMLNSYLEHEENPLGVLRALARVMRPGAPVVVKVPNFGSWNAAVMGASWCGVRLPDHLNYFTAESLERMAGVAGFTVTRPASANLPTNDNMWSILRRPA